MKLKFLERLMATKVEMWVLILLGFLGLFGLMGFAWLVRVSLADPSASFWTRLAYNMSDLPRQAIELSQTGLEINAHGQLVQRDPRRIDFDGPVGFQLRDPNFQDDGYLLLSSYDDQVKNSILSLYDLKEQKVIWRWVPDIDALLADTPTLQERLGDHPHPGMDPQHPYLMENGDVIFLVPKTGMLARINSNGAPVWTLDRTFHHSIERQSDGNFVVHSSERFGQGPVENCAYAIVTPDGKILEVHSVRDILVRHGYSGLLYGVGPWEEDITHLNDAEPMLATDEFVQEGDIAFSPRNISTVFLYRPSEDRIIWLQTGPWRNQHDVDYLGNGKFSIFNNNLYRGKEPKPEDHSHVLIYDAATGQTEAAHPKGFADLNLLTPTQGLHRHLRNGDIFVEMTDNAQLARVGPEGVRWTYTNPLSANGQVGSLHWCRYFHRDELDLSWLDKASANSHKE